MAQVINTKRSWLNHLLFGLFSLLTLLLAAPSLVKRSMYNDGIWYAVIARNLARGESSFWRPKLTATMYPEFYEHPPLGFGVQSLWFSLLGEGPATERIYAACVFAAAACLTVWLFRQLSGGNRWLWGLPLVLWIANEVTYVFFPANVLECLLTVFTLAAVGSSIYALENREKSRTYRAMVLAPLFLWAAFLTKGPVALFPLAVPFLYYCCVDRSSSRKALLMTVCLLGGGLAYAGLTLLLWPESADNLRQYFDSQVLAALSGERTTYHHRDNHFYIIGKLSVVLLPTLLLAGLSWWGAGRKGISISRKQWRKGLFLLFIGLSASLPLVVSPKQSYYYLLPSTPYFALAASLIIAPLLDSWRPSRTWYYGLSTVMVLGIIAASLGVFGSLGETVRRDADVITDVDNYGPLLAPAGIVGADTTTAHLVGYLARWYDVAVDTSETTAWQHPYFLRGSGLNQPSKAYKLVFPETGQKFELYRRN